MENKENKIIRFDMFSLVLSREKLCSCKNPHYEIDIVNRLVMCIDCGAVLEPYEALLKMCEYMKRYEDYQVKALEKCRIYGEMADKEFRRRLRNKAFKDMEQNYIQGLFPCCPKCNELIDPVEMTQWSRN